MTRSVEWSALQLPLFFLLLPGASSIFQRCHYFVPVYSKLAATKLGNKSGSSLSIEQSFIVIATPSCNGNNGRSVKFSKDKNRVEPGQFYRGSKAPCFQTLIIRISFHHGGAAAPILVGHRCFNKASWSTAEENEHRIYIWPPFLRSPQPFICMERVVE